MDEILSWTPLSLPQKKGQFCCFYCWSLDSATRIMLFSLSYLSWIRLPWTCPFYKPTLIKYYEHRMLSLSVQGKWKTSSNWNTLLDPLNGEPFIKVAEVDEAGIQVCIMSSLQVLYFLKDLPHYWLYIEAELKSLCFIMPSFHFPSLTSSMILSLKWLAFFFLAPSLTCLLMFAYLASKFFPNCDWIMQPFVESLSKCPKHGLHNPFKAPERFALLIWSLCPFFFPLLIYIYLGYFALRILW